jgi:hypothetical protein
MASIEAMVQQMTFSEGEGKMARYGVESKLSPAQVVEKALAFFGPGGLGLEVAEQEECCARFEGGGGHVFVNAAEKDKGSQVDLETREWDYQVKQFMGQI